MLDHPLIQRYINLGYLTVEASAQTKAKSVTVAPVATTVEAPIKATVEAPIEATVEAPIEAPEWPEYVEAAPELETEPDAAPDAEPKRKRRRNK